jgi:hypothetical protein
MKKALNWWYNTLDIMEKIEIYKRYYPTGDDIYTLTEIEIHKIYNHENTEQV